MRKVAALAAVLAIGIVAACGGDDDDGGSVDPNDEQLRATMRTMVIQEEDVPEGLGVLGGEFSTNEQAASGVGSGPTEEQFEEWGRVLGFAINYQRTEPINADVVSLINSTVSVYEDSTGASESFTNRVDQAGTIDWEANNSDLSEFQQEEVASTLDADDQLWLRFTGTAQIAPGEIAMVARDFVIFLVDDVYGSLEVISTSAAGGTDRELNKHVVEGLAEQQILRMNQGISTGNLDG